MASRKSESATCEGVALDSSNSPRFDINEFLKPSKDFNTEEQLLSFSEFNIPVPTSNMPAPLAPSTNRRSGGSDGGPESDFNALFFYGTEVDGDSAFTQDTLNEELIAFDETATDIVKDPFDHFSASPDRYMNNPPISPVSLEVPTHDCSLGRTFPSMTCPSTICTAGFYMLGDTGGLVDVEDQAFVSVEYGASTSGAAHSLNYNGAPLNWDITREGSIQQNFGKPQNQQFQCASCQILRRIVHSNERVMGANGGYLSKQIGHIAIPEVLCNASDYSNNGFTYGKAGLKQNKFHSSASTDNSDNADASVGLVKPPKSNAAAQRERTGKLRMIDLAQHFHLPINAAAKELGICPTVLKKICRRNGMRRWPHRKIKSIERIIATLEQTIAEGAGQGDEGIRMEIAMLRSERAQLCAGFLGDV